MQPSPLFVAVLAVVCVASSGLAVVWRGSDRGHACRQLLHMQVGKSKAELMPLCQGVLQLPVTICEAARQELHGEFLKSEEVEPVCAILAGMQHGMPAARSLLQTQVALLQRRSLGQLGSEDSSTVQLDAALHRKKDGGYLVKSAYINPVDSDVRSAIAYDKGGNAVPEVHSVDQTIAVPPDSNGNPYDHPKWIVNGEAGKASAKGSATQTGSASAKVPAATTQTAAAPAPVAAGQAPAPAATGAATQTASANAKVPAATTQTAAAPAPVAAAPASALAVLGAAIQTVSADLKVLAATAQTVAVPDATAQTAAATPFDEAVKAAKTAEEAGVVPGLTAAAAKAAEDAFEVGPAQVAAKAAADAYEKKYGAESA